MRGERRTALTPREREVLALIHIGLTNEEIAARLGISPDTAKFHVSQILAKLGVATRDEAAALAMPEERGWWRQLGAWGLAAKLALAAGAAAAVAGVVVLAWAVSTTGPGGAGADHTPGASPTPSPFESPFGAIAWVDSTPAPYAASPAATPTVDPLILATPECRGDQLAGVYTGSRFAGGYTFVEFVIANVSAAPCRLSGSAASFQYLGAAGDVLVTGQQAECSPLECAPALLAAGGSIGSTGQEDPAARALFSIRGFDPAPGACEGSGAVSEIRLTMPGGGAFTIPEEESGKCLGPDLGPFVPEEQTIHPPPPRVALITSAQLPAKTAAGQELNFAVEITNVSDSPFSFGDVCPNYILIVGNKAVYDTHALNCRPAGTIAAGGHALFAMQVAVPADLAPGAYDIDWSLDAPYAQPDRQAFSEIEVVTP
jgi:DNA-binding CsgD family transcriptional regulator